MGKNYNSSRLVNGLSVGASGNVGIGTTSPSQILHVYGTSIRPQIESTANGGYSTLRFVGKNSAGTSRTFEVGLNVSADDVWQITNGTTAFVNVNTSGNVGIGATPTDFGSSYTVLDVYNGTVGGYLLARSPNVTGQISVDNNTAMYVQTRTNHPIVFALNNSEKMRITSSGYVGIGTASPNQIFTIKAAGANNGLISFQNTAGTATSYVGVPNANGDVVTTSTTADLCLRNETGNMLFSFSNQERMRLTNGGDLYVNTTGNYGTTTVSVRSAWSAGSYGQVQFYTGTGNATIRSSVPGNSTNGIQILTYASSSGDKITANFDGFGNVYNYNNSSGWQQTSDIRVKENIRPITGALEKINSLNPTHFEYKNKLGKTKTGFIAQEFEQVFPGHTLETAPPDDLKQYFEEGEMMKAIDADLIPYLVKAMQ